jgi:hypothetical protein
MDAEDGWHRCAKPRRDTTEGVARVNSVCGQAASWLRGASSCYTNVNAGVSGQKKNQFRLAAVLAPRWDHLQRGASTKWEVVFRSEDGREFLVWVGGGASTKWEVVFRSVLSQQLI